jgi:hypothetical protein
MHAGQHDHIRFDVDRLARQRQTVADDIRDAMKDFRSLVVVGEDDRIAARIASTSA